MVGASKLTGVVDHRRFDGDVGAMTQGTFVYLRRGFDLPLDHTEREAALLAFDENLTDPFFNLAQRDIVPMT